MGSPRGTDTRQLGCMCTPACVLKFRRFLLHLLALFLHLANLFFALLDSLREEVVSTHTHTHTHTHRHTHTHTHTHTQRETDLSHTSPCAGGLCLRGLLGRDVRGAGGQVGGRPIIQRLLDCESKGLKYCECEETASRRARMLHTYTAGRAR